MLGISGFYPKFVKKFVNLEKIIENSIKKYKKEIISKKFRITIIAFNMEKEIENKPNLNFKEYFSRK